MKALSLHVTGIVQGVGFRPFVYNLAVERGLVGWVLAGKNVHNKSWQDGNFYDLCILD